ncbi:hypothetical protein Ais01nite_82690 [Asanoa ishikariensis]|uniref:Uncharacterized protein n=1 Tax=Asanoa ishikariensis TaxID=137265 RepID=A0A1H3SAJ6_9ACTN|nr:hypothetical protein [Asanoa ishikariensis]GIF70234.1 hypothetical protein Ais01nite_82690 [Asanoa ishikariensis]SDZ34954.1 hypothetical protein SAMN05421684_4770 [Asanoa ishikariensis]
MRTEEGAVVDLLPKMAPEAPDGYVSFVGRHLTSLRLESAQLAGDAWHAEEIYPEALTDVAARWQWLELRAHWFGRPGAADDYLRQVLTDRAKRWRAEQIYEVEMVVLRADPAEAVDGPGTAAEGASGPGGPGRASAAGDAATTSSGGPVFALVSETARQPSQHRLPAAPFTTADQQRLPPAPFTTGPSTASSAGLARYRRTGPGRSSIGLRQARFLSPKRLPPAPIAEAAIAWWHAYVAQRRRKRVASVVAVILLLAALTNLRATGRM